MVVFIGRGGRHIARKNALEHVIGYSICKDASVRDVQFRTPQWTMGKNFDDTGAIGPCFVSADELPAGGAGLRIETRLNGEVARSANRCDMVFDVATLIEILSDAMTLSPGDVIVSGTPAGVGFARKPPLWMTAGDTVEVEIEGIGLLRNPIADEPRPLPAGPSCRRIPGSTGGRCVCSRWKAAGPVRRRDVRRAPAARWRKSSVDPRGVLPRAGRSRAQGQECRRG